MYMLEERVHSAFLGGALWSVKFVDSVVEAYFVLAGALSLFLQQDPGRATMTLFSLLYFAVVSVLLNVLRNSVTGLIKV